MDIKLKQKIDEYFSKNEHELFKGQPVDSKTIESAEKQLKVKFDEDYKEFISNFGGSFIGLPIYAFNNSNMLSDETVIDLTLEFRSTYLIDNRFPLVQDSCVISMSGNGDPVIISPEGNIIIFYHDNNEEEVLASSFKELIQMYL